MLYLAYSLTTGRVRGGTSFTPQEDAQGAKRQPGKGEAVVIVPPESVGNLNVLQAYVTQLTGLTPANDRFIAVDQQTHQIVSVFIGDVVGCGDGVPGCDHYAHPGADPSWTFDPVQSTVIAPALTAQQIAQIAAAKQQSGMVWAQPAPPLPQPVVKIMANAGSV